MSCRVANNSGGFQGSFEVINFNRGNFLGSFSVARAGLPGAPGASLTPVPGSPLGFMPYASFNGVAVTNTLNIGFKSTSQTGGVPASISWEIDPGDGASRGGVEWMKVRLAYEADAPVDTALTSYDIREVEFYPTASPDESGQFYRTLMVDGKTIQGYSDYSYQFDNLPSGNYQLLCEAKQTFNPNPFVITKKFTVGNALYNILASGVPASGDNPLSVAFTSKVLEVGTGTDVTSSFEFIHWDFGTSRLYGTNTSFYRNPTYIFDRQGFYNPVVTFIGPKSSPRHVSAEAMFDRAFYYPPHPRPKTHILLSDTVTFGLFLYISDGLKLSDIAIPGIGLPIIDAVKLSDPAILYEKKDVYSEKLPLSELVKGYKNSSQIF